MDAEHQLEKAVLLGLITLAGSSSTAISAIAGIVVSAAAALVVCLLSLLLKLVDRDSKWLRWSLLLSAGFGTSWLLAGIIPYLLPLPSGTLIFLQIAGVSPIVFYGVAGKVSALESAGVWAYFGAAMIIAGIFRELLGRGTLFGYLPGGSYTIPADFMAGPIGAFLTAGTMVLAARIVALLKAQRSSIRKGSEEHE
ncbi:hypothetical protein [Spirochaeta dissipatitropha]